MSQLSSASPPTRRRPLRRILRNWLERHRHPFNFWIHMIGIPMAVVGVVLLCLQYWIAGAACFVGGYFLQYIGHRVEGNDVGEWAAIKRMLGLPYVGIAPVRNESLPPPYEGGGVEQVSK
jgi:hypothetical protein